MFILHVSGIYHNVILECSCSMLSNPIVMTGSILDCEISALTGRLLARASPITEECGHDASTLLSFLSLDDIYLDRARIAAALSRLVFLASARL